MSSINFHPIAVDTGTSDREGCLALVNDRLVAVLTRLDPALHDEPGCADHWHVEATFPGVLWTPRHTFSDLDQCRAWLASHYG
jgi:hypothetical protein